MNTWRHWLPALALALALAVGLTALLRGLRDDPDVPDTTSMVGVVTSDPGPRPSAAERLEGQPSTPGDPSLPDTPSPTGPLPRTAWISGEVVDETGRILPGASVEVRRIDVRSLRGAPYPDGPPLASTTTDRDGAFRLAAPGGAWLRLAAHAPGRARVARRVAASGARVNLVLPRAAELTVRSVDTEGDPVADARVRVVVGASPTEGTTDAEGVLRLDALPPGSAQIQVGADGHGTVKVPPVALASARPTEVLAVLPAGVRLQGMVIDAATREPLAGAAVRVARPGESSDAGTTDADGRFDAVPGGGVGQRVFVSVDADGYTPALHPVVLMAAHATQDVVIPLQAGSPWRGTVVFPRDVPRVPVTVSYTDNGVAGRPRVQVQADDEGRFELPPPPPPAPGRRVVLVAEAGDLRAALALRPHQPPPRPLFLVLEGGRGVSGRLVSGGGTPVVGALLRLHPRWARGEARTRLTPQESLLRLANERGLAGLAAATDAQGRFRLQGVPQGRFALHAEIDGQGRFLGDVVDVGAEDLDVGTLTVGGGPVLEGRVRGPDGTPLAGVQMRLTARDDPTRRLQATSTADGGYRFEDVRAGAWRLQADLPPHPRFDTAVEMGVEDRVLDVDLDATARLRGRLHAPTGAPEGLVRVQLRRADGRPAGPPHTVALSGSGRFQWDGVPPGAWRVHVAAPGGQHAHTAEVLRFVAGEATDARLDLEPGARLTGRLRRSDDAPVAGGVVRLRHTVADTVHLLTTDAQGRFERAGLQPGAWAVDLSGPGGVPLREDIVLDAGETTTLDTRLPAGGHLQVTVVDAEGDPVPGALLLFRNDVRSFPGTPPDRTDAEGAVTRRDLPGGRMWVRARGRGGLQGTAATHVVPGETTSVTVRVGSPPSTR